METPGLQRTTPESEKQVGQVRLPEVLSTVCESALEAFANSAELPQHAGTKIATQRGG